MASEQSATARPFELGTSMLRPDEITSEGLPITRRGYDRGYVDRLLERTREAYSLTLKKNQSQRERLVALEADVAAAEGEAAASARAVADLMQKMPAADHGKDLSELEARLARSERARERALADLREESERASDLARQVQSLEQELRDLRELRAQTPPAEHTTQPVVEHVQPGAEGDAARLLLAATRAAEDVRVASRARALRTLTKARELASLVDAQAERERVALTESLERRTQVEHEAEELLAEAHRVDTEIAERRVQIDRVAEEKLAEVQRIESEAHERRAQVDREAEERLAEVQRIESEAWERRAQADREAEETLSHARAEADRLVAGVEEERNRMRELLSGALELLEAETAPADPQQESLVDDLSSRLHETPGTTPAHGD